MKILVLTNLYPPHHAGTYNLRCQSVVEALQLRGHVLMVLTSNYGLKGEQRGSDVDRRLRLQGAFDQPAMDGYREMKELETHNNQVLTESVVEFQPDLIYVFSLRGLSKSLMLTLRASRKPYLYDVDDYWIVNELREDPWLFWWNSNNTSFQSNVMRRGLEMGGQRDKLDGVAPTRCQMGLDRLPEIFSKPQVELEPNSVGVFHFNRLHFCSHALKDATEKAGFRVGHAEVIHPGIPTHQFHGQLKSPDAPFKKLIICCDLHAKNGVMTALEAVQHLHETDRSFTLDVYGRGESDYVAQLRSFVARHELPVHFMTVSNLNKDMPAIYRLHDAFLHTPEWEEPFSIEPIEAMACGLPVIGTTCGGVGEFLKHGQNSFTFPPGNPKDLANRIIEMQEKPQLRCRMADAAQQDVLAIFNETTVTDQIENYLNGTIEMWNA